jgi:hypothetical protein
VQNAQSTRLVSPLVSFDVFREYFANYQTRKKKNKHPEAAQEEVAVGEEEGKEVPVEIRNKKLLPYFLEERLKLKALVHLPTLVSFYKLLRENFAYKITLEQANSMTVPQCIALLQNDGTQNAATTSSAWQSFKEAWAGNPPLSLCFVYLKLIIFRNKRKVGRTGRMQRPGDEPEVRVVYHESG